MRKYRANRGFTLVELIVVIAIIGVLAAILIPTIIGMVAKAKVTSANTTADSIQEAMNLLLLQADSNHFGIVSGEVIKFDIIAVTSGGSTTWSCSAAPAGSYNNDNGSGITWGSAATYVYGEDMSGNTSGEKMVCAAMCNKFPEIKGAAMVIVLHGGNCTFAAYTADINTPLPESEYPPITNGKPPASFEWNGEEAGHSPEGLIVGTAPAIGIS